MKEIEEFKQRNKAEIEEMFIFLEQPADDDVFVLIAKLSAINVYLARSGRLLAEAKALQDRATYKVFAENGKDIAKMSPTIAAKYISAMCYDINEEVNRLDRINRALVHSADNIRTMVSFAKQDLSLQRQGY